MKKVNKTVLFLSLTFGISYGLAGVYYLLGGMYPTTSGTILAIAYMFVPMLVVLLIEKVIYREKIKASLLISFQFNRWFILAWLLPPVISLGAFGIALLFPEVSFTLEMEGMMDRFAYIMSPEQQEEMRNTLDDLPVHPFWLTLGQGLVAGITINAIAGFGEELGWRGFLLRAFWDTSFFQASLLIGIIWGVWHVPLILMGHNYPQHPQWGVLMMTVWCILLTPLFLFITLKAQSVIAASIMHGTLNGTAGLAILLIDGGSDLTVGVTGLAGFLSLGLVLVLLFVYDQWISHDQIMHRTIGHSTSSKQECQPNDIQC